MVGTARFELATSRTPSVRATRLRYVPTAAARKKGRKPDKSTVSLGFEQRQETAQGIAQVQQHFAVQLHRLSFTFRGGCRASQPFHCRLEADPIFQVAQVAPHAG